MYLSLYENKRKLISCSMANCFLATINTRHKGKKLGGYFSSEQYIEVISVITDCLQ